MLNSAGGWSQSILALCSWTTGREIHCPALAWACLLGIEHLPCVIPGYRLYYHPHFCEPGVCPSIVATLLKLIDLQIQSVYRNQETTVPNIGPELPTNFTFQALKECFMLYGSGHIKCTVKSWLLHWVHDCFCTAAVEVRSERSNYIYFKGFLVKLCDKGCLDSILRDNA